MNGMTKNLIILALITCGLTRSIDNPHFYRATFFYGEPRFERDWLSSLDFSFAGGSTNCSRANSCKKTALLNLYGPHNMHDLGQGVPGKSTTDPVDIALTNLALVPSHDCFANLKFGGTFSTLELDTNLIQNLVRGFFIQVYIPFRQLRIKDICFEDLSSSSDCCPNVDTPAWQTFLNLFPDAILKKYNLSIGSIKRRGSGDTTVLAGWTYNYQGTEALDYFDSTIKFGGLAPTGHKKNPNIVFDLPLGYDGHPGIVAELEGSLGAYDWVTAGGYIGAIVFLDRSKTLRMKTDINQNGFIKLAEGKACVHKGTLWNAGVYGKADHLCRGISMWFGYTFVQQNADYVQPQDTKTFDATIVNSDEMFKEWNMHTLHIMTEYDFTTEYSSIGPRLGVFYNHIITGKRIFNTHMIGGAFGIDITWEF